MNRHRATAVSLCIGSLFMSLGACAAGQSVADRVLPCEDMVLGANVTLERPKSGHSKHTEDKRIFSIALCNSKEQYVVVEVLGKNEPFNYRELYSFTTAVEPATKELRTLNFDGFDNLALLLTYHDIGDTDSPVQDMLVFPGSPDEKIRKFTSWSQVQVDESGNTPEIVIWERDFEFESILGVYMPHRYQLSSTVSEVPLVQTDLERLRGAVESATLRSQEPGCELRLGSAEACNRSDELVALSRLLDRLLPSKR